MFEEGQDSSEKAFFFSRKMHPSIKSSPDLWDEASREYDSNIGARALKGAHELVAAALSQRPLSQDSKVLDVGTGAGNIPLAIRELHPSVSIVAIDSSPGMVDILAQRNIANIVTGVSDARSLDRILVPEDTFTHAFCALVLQFVGDRQAEVLSEIFRSVQPGGVVAISVSDYLGIVEPMHNARKLVDPNYSRVEPFDHTWHTSKQLDEGLKKAGFTNVDAYEVVTENRAPSPESIINFWVNMRNPGLRPVVDAFPGNETTLRDALERVLRGYEEGFRLENRYAIANARKPS